MLPVLLHIGPVKIYSFGVFFALGLFFGVYWWWKLGRDEHWDEILLFDSFFLSLFLFFIGGRVGYIATHWSTFSVWYRWLSLLSYPGLAYGVGAATAFVFLFLFAKIHAWDVWKMFDAAAVVLALVVAITAIGSFLNGSDPGMAWKYGLVYTSLPGKHVPVDIWLFVWSLLSFAIVSRVRKEFRFYAWYKGGESTAREGLAGFVFLGLVGVYYAAAGLLEKNMFHSGLGLAFLLISLGAVWWRSALSVRFRERAHLLQ